VQELNVMAAGRSYFQWREHQAANWSIRRFVGNAERCSVASKATIFGREIDSEFYAR